MGAPRRPRRRAEPQSGNAPHHPRMWPLIGLSQLGSVQPQIILVDLLWPATRLWAPCSVERATLGVGLDVSGLALASTTVCVCNAEKCGSAEFSVCVKPIHTREIAVPSGLGPSSSQSSQVKSSQVKSSQVKSRPTCLAKKVAWAERSDYHLWGERASS